MAKAVLYRGLWGFAIAVTRTTAVPTASLGEFVITIMTDNCASRPSSVVCRLSLGWVSLMKFKWTYEYYRSDLCDLLSRRGGVGNRFMNGLCGLEINFLYLHLRESRVEMVNCRVRCNWEQHTLGGDSLRSGTSLKSKSSSIIFGYQFEIVLKFKMLILSSTSCQWNNFRYYNNTHVCAIYGIISPSISWKRIRCTTCIISTILELSFVLVLVFDSHNHMRVRGDLK